MYRTTTLAFVLLAGVGIGAAGVTNLQAQNKGPGAYAIIDLSQITDRDAFVKQLLPKGESAALSAGGKFVTRTEKIVALDGTHPSASSSLLSTALTRLRPGTLRRPRKRSTPCARNSQGRARSSSRPRASHHDGPRLNAASQVKRPLHSITSSARPMSGRGKAMPSAFGGFEDRGPQPRARLRQDKPEFDPLLLR